MLENVLVVIRAATERTIALCEHLALREVPRERVKVIQEKPFSAAVKKTFQLGLESGATWTLALDADILLRSNAIRDLVYRAEQLPDNFFMIQGRVLDKLFCLSRNGGPHLFRTSLIEKALPLVPDQSETLRPEGETVRRMISHGFHRYKGVETYGLHDFEQRYADIFSKSFIHAIKFRKQSDYFLTEWASREKTDVDYLLARLGFVMGSGHSLATKPGHDELRKIAHAFMHQLSIEEKRAEMDIDPDTIINTFVKSQAAVALENKEHNLIMRSDFPEKKEPKARKTWLARFGKFLENRGKRLQ